MKTTVGKIIFRLIEKFIDLNYDWKGNIFPELKRDFEKLLPIVEMIANSNAPVNLASELEAALKELEED